MGLSIAVLIFGALLLAGEVWAFIYQEKMTELFAFRLIAFTIVVIAALVLAVSTVGPDKVAPAFGVVGLVAGYAAGKDAAPPN